VCNVSWILCIENGLYVEHKSERYADYKRVKRLQSTLYSLLTLNTQSHYYPIVGIVLSIAKRNRT
jgi:hypothetical protein